MRAVADRYRFRQLGPQWELRSFVARGYAVLNYTARGFHGSCGPEAGSDPACAKGWTHLADRRFEIRDTKYLVGLLADAGVAVPGDQRRCQRLPGPLRPPREQDAAGQHLLRTRYDLRRHRGRALQGRNLSRPRPWAPAPRRRRRIAGDDLGGRRPAGLSRDRPDRERGNVHHARAGPVVGSRHVGLPGGRLASRQIPPRDGIDACPPGSG